MDVAIGMMRSGNQVFGRKRRLFQSRLQPKDLCVLDQISLEMFAENTARTSVCLVESFAVGLEQVCKWLVQPILVSRRQLGEIVDADEQLEAMLEKPEGVDRSDFSDMLLAKPQEIGVVAFFYEHRLEIVA